MKYDNTVSWLFFGLTLAFIIVFMTNQQFFNWTFERHHNQLSWYIRPFFLIPFCYFAYKRCLAGISITIFCLITSMFWFGRPIVVDEQVVNFLQFEKEWLQGGWDNKKMLSIILIPTSFFGLGYSFWKRNLFIGLAVMALMATGKILWSIQNAGESGESIIPPAIVGLMICVGLIFLGFKKLEQ